MDRATGAPCAPSTMGGEGLHSPLDVSGLALWWPMVVGSPSVVRTMGQMQVAGGLMPAPCFHAHTALRRPSLSSHRWGPAAHSHVEEH